MNYTARAFFLEHAGYSYDPKTETQRAGHLRCAGQLACAEEWAAQQGYVFEWEQDHITNREFTDEGPEYYLWSVVMRDTDSNAVQSLGGVDFGETGDYRDPYARVCQAELALEQYTELEAQAKHHEFNIATDGG